MNKLNGFNNGIDTTDGIGGQESPFETMKRVYGTRCTKCGNTPCSCELNEMEWWRKRIVEEMTRKELEDRLCEYHQEINKLKEELSKLKSE